MQNIFKNKLYFDLIYDIPVSIAIFDLNMCYIAYSKKWLEDYNLEKNADLKGKSHYDIFPNIPVNFIATHEEALKGKTINGKKDLFKNTDESISYINWEVKPWYEVDNTIGGIIITTEDVTASVNLELRVSELKLQIDENLKKEKINSLINLELNATKEKLENKQIELEIQNQELQAKEQDLLFMAVEHKEIFQNAPNPYIIIDKHLKIINYNKIANKEFKIIDSNKEFIASLIDKESFLIFFEHLNSAYYNVEPIIVKIKINVNIVKNYKLTIVEHPIYKEQYLLVFINIDNELLVIEQTKLASMGEMLSNITHQWRQPLNLVSMGVSELNYYYKNDMEVKKEKAIFSLNFIQEQIIYMNETINTFSDFLKNDRSLLHVSFQELVYKSLKILESTLNSNNIKIIKNFPSEEIYIKSITGELEQVIINIVNNAKDAFIEKNIKNRELSFTLSFEKQKAILKIEDNAGGITKEVLPYIFQAHFSTKKDNQGMGIGLHMCKRIITESLNGELYASNSEKGAIFYIVL